ncbi:MAG: Uma2 family endonuclease [Bacteroidia bacterium]|nr:Uma2 family endonuclease [Bacteroidia bacterium]
MSKQHSLEAYLELERETGERLEYLGGVIRAMAGTTIEHETIVSNISQRIRRCLYDKGCQVFSGNLKMHAPDGDKAFLHPDIHIYCGEVKKYALPKGAYALEYPVYIIEVLSKSTRNYDRGKKFECYRKIPTLQNYLLIESTKVEVFQRDMIFPNQFIETRYTEQDTELDILGCKISLKEIYEFVGF